jgi:peptidoglycan/LPS O-acetylase OafA/YrhL
MTGWSIARRLFAVDILAMAFVAALGGATAARAAQIPGWPAVVLGCGAITLAVPLLGFLRTHLDLAPVRLLHDWSFALYLYAIHAMVMLVAAPLHDGRVFDEWLIAADRLLAGGDPAAWFSPVAHPLTTEACRIAYAAFPLLPLLVTVELYTGTREWRFRQWAFVCACGFFAAYAGYLTLPAAGPRFTMPAGLDADALRVTARDGFPGGHTLVTLLAMAWAWRYRLRVRWTVTVLGLLLVVATVYLRHDYVAGVMAGAALAGICLAVAPALHRWLAHGLGTIDADRAA